MSIEQIKSSATGIPPTESPSIKVEANAHFETGKDATRLIAKYALNTQD